MCVTNLLTHSHSWPQYEVGPDAPIFPITLLCRNQHERTRYSVLSPFLHAMYRRFGNNRVKICQELDKLSTMTKVGAALLRSQSSYVVLEGNDDRELICFCWCANRPPLVCCSDHIHAGPMHMYSSRVKNSLMS